VAEYFLSVLLRDKAGMIIRRVFMLRAQIIILIILLKMVKMGMRFVQWKNQKKQLVARFKL
jgi:hypothetical protein